MKKDNKKKQASAREEGKIKKNAGGYHRSAGKKKRMTRNEPEASSSLWVRERCLQVKERKSFQDTSRGTRTFPNQTPLAFRLSTHSKEGATVFASKKRTPSGSVAHNCVSWEHKGRVSENTSRIGLTC